MAKPVQNLQAQLAQLQLLYEQRLLSEENYRAALVGLGVDPAVVLVQQQVPAPSMDDLTYYVPIEQASGLAVGNGARVDMQFNVAHLYQIYQAAPGRAELSEAEFRKVLADYLGWVVREYGYTRLHGLQLLQGTGALNRPLAQVYTSLAVQYRPAVIPGGDDALFSWQNLSDGDETDIPDEPQLVDMADLLTLGERIAIVGGAGSGKTTYLSFVASSLASALGGQPLDARLKSHVPDTPLLVPLLAPLRFWEVYRGQCAQIPGLRIIHGPDQGSLGAFLLWFLRARYKNFDAAGDFFDCLLRGGQGCLILLDGLDEVVSLAERQIMRDEIDRLLRSQYPGNRCLVTAREAGYRDAPFGDDFVRCDVQPVSKEQIASLVHAWCNQIYPQPRNHQAACEDLLTAINRLNAERRRRGRKPLVTSPLMVTMVVSVKYSRRELPRERAKLYDACVDVILNSGYTGLEDDAGARQRVVYAGGPPDKQREWLSRLAFQIQLSGKAGTSLDEAEVRAILEPVFQERGEGSMLDSFLAAVRQRGGLLEERGGRFQFMHLTFQEYLAAQFLSRQWVEQSPGFLAEAVTEKRWRESLLLTMGSLGAPVPYEHRRAFIAALCQLEGTMAARLAAAELAATGLCDLTDPEPTLQAIVRAQLSALLRDPALIEVKPAARILAGNALAILGDERDLDELVAVPSGPFWMGSSNTDAMARDDERPQHKVTLPTFKIGKYPVTNAQYLRFVEATGREWNSDIGQRLERANHPAANVSWRDARAYCDWLTGVWRAEGRIATNEVVRLPSEAEWEKAARGTDGRIYPWGDEWDETKCNTEELGQGDTTPVGVFPDGASPYGCLDIAGNVWEWTTSLWGEDVLKLEFRYPYNPTDGRENFAARDKNPRVMRGGSFYYYCYFARCAYRYWHYPYDDWCYYGFRIVVSPSEAESKRVHSFA